jgi:hypothetical protein
MTMFSCTHFVRSVGVTGYPMWGGVKFKWTDFTTSTAPATAMTAGTSVRGLGSEESAGTRVRSDLEATENDI